MFQLLRRQSRWFLSVRLTAKYFLSWRVHVTESREEKDKSSVALWHWSLVLQRKVWTFPCSIEVKMIWS